MGTVIFDFDSTLVRIESLDRLLAGCLGHGSERRAEIEAITQRGMSGEIPFGESLRQRLALAAPHREDLVALAGELAAEVSDGAADLVAALQRDGGHTVRVVTGGIFELVAPCCLGLGLPPDHIHAVEVRWSPEGRLLGPDPACAFSQSKTAGMAALALPLERPAVAVGDGATDLALRTEGHVDAFVAYTEHARREAVVAGADCEARSMHELRAVLTDLLGASKA